MKNSLFGSIDATMNLLTTKEAADRLGVTPVRVCAMIAAGRLPAKRFGRAYMIKESDLKLVAYRKPGRPARKATKYKGGKK